ncbi:ankyrin repeat-containing domain protein [Biscogniauxia sp. FL1348]|nr:ankyrin repeat-containing domain protein [Biscogniauxia sp. FL1348]
MSCGEVASEGLQESQLGFSSIPVETLLHVASYLTLSETFKLAKVCRGTYECLRTVIYKRDAGENDQYALWFACVHNRMDTLQRVLDYKTHDINRYFERDHIPKARRAMSGFGKHQTPLIVAIRTCNHCIVKALLRSGANPNIPDKMPVQSLKRCWFPVNWAMTITNESKWTRVIKMLAKENANLDQSPVISSDHQQQHEAESIEISDSSVVMIRESSQGGLRYQLRLFEESAPIFQLLKFVTPKTTTEHENRPTTALEYNEDFKVTLSGQARRLKLLLELGANADVRQPGLYQTPMFYLLVKLLDWEPRFYFHPSIASAQEKSQQHTVLAQAAVATLSQLRSYGADTKAQCPYQDFGGTETVSLLHLACKLYSRQGGAIIVLDWLLKNGADINATSTTGRTPLSFLCRNPPDNLGIIRQLVKMGANVNHQNLEGSTPLHELWVPSTTWNPEIQLVKMLLQLGADPSIRDQHGRTPLFDYMRSPPEQIGILVEMIKKGASPKDRDDNGSTPLHELCSVRLISTEHRIRLVKLLLRNGADISAKDNNGRTAIDCVKELLRGESKLIKFLQDATANPWKWNGKQGGGNKARGKK